MKKKKKKKKKRKKEEEEQEEGKPPAKKRIWRTWLLGFNLLSTVISCEYRQIIMFLLGNPMRDYPDDWYQSSIYSTNYEVFQLWNCIPLPWSFSCSKVFEKSFFLWFDHCTIRCPQAHQSFKEVVENAININ